MRVLVVNAGSSSLKLTLLGDDDAVLAHRELDAPESQVAAEDLHAALSDGLDGADVVGHRIVHGGARHRVAVRVDDHIRSELDELTALAPLHQPKSLAALDAVSAALPDLPAVACFDTAFHTTLSPAATTYALPAAWRERWGVRRYGFHGLSHAWVARRTEQMLGNMLGRTRIVSCHLGAGASLCAIDGGRSVDTTMGFTPLEGLVMATRSGSVDPGLLLWLLERTDLDERGLAEALEHDSGLRGLCGRADMREVLAAARADHGDARLALEVYLHRLCAGVAAMAATLRGLDVLVFTGGVGEHADEIRARAAAGLAFLGVAVDAEANAGAQPDTEITGTAAHVRTFVIAAREDLEIARQAREALGAG